MIPVTPSMKIVLNAWNSLSSNVVSLQLLFKLPNGELNFSELSLTPTTDKVKTSASLPLHNAELIHVFASSSASNLFSGQCFLQVLLVKTAPSADIPIHVLMQNYLTSAVGISWPGSTRINSTDGKGYTHTNTSPDTINNMMCKWIVPANTAWKINVMYSMFDADATVANRTMEVQISDGTINLLATNGPGNITASEQYSFTASPTTQRIVASVFSTPITDALLLAGYYIRFKITNSQAGDLFSLPALNIEEFIIT